MLIFVMFSNFYNVTSFNYFVHNVTSCRHVWAGWTVEFLVFAGRCLESILAPTPAPCEIQRNIKAFDCKWSI